MTDGWSNPGRTGAVLYGLAAAIAGTVVAIFSRLRLAKHRGRRSVVSSLPDGPLIIVSNHASYVDGILLALVCRREGRSVRLLATAGVFRIPLVGGLARRLGFIPVKRGATTAADALDVAAEALAAGEAIGIFPEGRTTRDPNQWPERAKTGAVRLALRSGAPIVPIAMVGTHRVLSKKSPIRTILKAVVLRPEVLTNVGEPIDVSALLTETGADTKDDVDVRLLTDHVWAKVVAVVEALRNEAAPDSQGVVVPEDKIS
jgi:1-acyl-sn-glycerol-3-phosphate acyltransferase